MPLGGEAFGPDRLLRDTYEMPPGRQSLPPALAKHMIREHRALHHAHNAACADDKLAGLADRHQGTE